VVSKRIRNGNPVFESPQPTGEPNAYANVYANISIDYSKLHVTPDIMLAVLSGNAAGLFSLHNSRRHVHAVISADVLQPSPARARAASSTALAATTSSSSSRVDTRAVLTPHHSTPPHALHFSRQTTALLAFSRFPRTDRSALALHADKLHATISSMHAANEYSKMMLYVEACESGSMFNKILDSNVSVYAVTASTPFESSYACYEDNYAHTYIGDCFPTMCAPPPCRCAAMPRCHNLLPVDGELRRLRLGFGNARSPIQRCARRHKHLYSLRVRRLVDSLHHPGAVLRSQWLVIRRRRPSPPPLPLSQPVSSRDVPIKILQRKVASAASSSEAALARSQSQSELSARAAVDQRFAAGIAGVLAAGGEALAADLLAPFPTPPPARTGPQHQTLSAPSVHSTLTHPFAAASQDYSLQYFKVLRRACASPTMASRIRQPFNTRAEHNLLCFLANKTSIGARNALSPVSQALALMIDCETKTSLNGKCWTGALRRLLRLHYLLHDRRERGFDGGEGPVTDMLTISGEVSGAVRKPAP